MEKLFPDFFMTGVHFEAANLEMLSRRREANSKKNFLKHPMHTCRKDTEILVGLGRAEEALTWLEKATGVPGLTPQELDDARMRLEFAKHDIIGDSEIISSVFLERLSTGEDIEALKKLYNSAITGNRQSDDLSEAFEIVEKMLTGSSSGRFSLNNALKLLPDDARKIKDYLIVLYARDAMSKNEISEVEGLIPEIERLAGSNSAFQLDAAFFLARFRQEKGESITWESISPLLSRLFDLPETSILNHLMDLSAILILLDERELLKASAAIAALLKKITFDKEDERTLTAVIQNSAFSIDIKDAFFTLLVRMAVLAPDNAGWWLEHLSRLKYLSGYRGQRLQKEAELFRYSSELPEYTDRILGLAESLTRHSLEKQGFGSTDRKKEEIELMTLLYPLYSKRRSSQKDKKLDIGYPEIIHIETAGYRIVENYQAPVISVLYANNYRDIDCPEVEISRSHVWGYVDFLKGRRSFKESINKGMELRRALFPISDNSDLTPLIGVRSTGIYHCIPLDSLPLSIDEETGKVTHWAGENMVSVLLTGENKDMSILEKQLNIKNIAVFANSSFGGNFPDLTGIAKEVEIIENIFRAKTDMFLDLYRETESNRGNFLQLSGRETPQIIHIASHGIAREQYLSDSFIALSSKDSQGNPILGAVGYHDIMLMDLRQCDLVVLSACSTHEGKSILGEGIMGLAWAFKAAGARAVIGTRWGVDDEAAAAFWRKFYENLCGGLPIGQAFQDARLHIMKQEKWSHPCFWGVFQLIA